MCLCVHTYQVYKDLCGYMHIYAGWRCTTCSPCGLRSLKARPEDLESILSSPIFSLFALNLCPNSWTWFQTYCHSDSISGSVSWLWPTSTHLDIWEGILSHMEVREKSKTLGCKFLTRLCTTYNFQACLRLCLIQRLLNYVAHS